MTKTLITPLGDDGLIVRPLKWEAIEPLATKLRQSKFWAEVVPGLDSVGVIFDPLILSVEGATSVLRTQWEEAVLTPADRRRILTIPVKYGGDEGPDLKTVCRYLSMSTEEFISYHTSKSFPVKMVGFAPGFAYIGGFEFDREIPRLDTPRLHVPAGSVAVAARYTGVYPLKGPAGWMIIGQTNKVLFDPAKTDPFLLCAGDVVAFRAEGAL